MANQRQWDEYEAVILLDIFLRTIEGEFTRQKAIKYASEILRNLAISRGEQIDEIFRNENGIFFQMQSMEAAYLEKDVIIGSKKPKTATKLFTVTVKLYHNNKEKYEKLLKEAYSMLEQGHFRQASFMAWLATQESKKKLEELEDTYQAIENYRWQSKAVRKDFFSLYDPKKIRKIGEELIEHPEFLSQNATTPSLVYRAVDYYCKFLMENSFGNPAVYEKESRAIAKQKAMQEVQPAIISNESDCLAKTIVEDPQIPMPVDQKPIEKNPPIVNDKTKTTCNDSQTETVEKFYLYDTINFEEYIPVSISYFDEKAVAFSWRNCYVEAMKFLLEDYPQKFKQYIWEGFFPQSKLGAITDSRRNLKSPEKLSPEVYAETYYSNAEFQEHLKNWFEYCNVDLENFQIYCKKSKPNPTAKPVDDAKPENWKVPEIVPLKKVNFSVEVEKQRSMFTAWMHKEKIDPEIIIQYLSGIKICNDYAEEYGYCKENLYLMYDPFELQRIMYRLLNNVSFSNLNDEKNHNLRTAMAKLRDYRFCVMHDHKKAITEEPGKTKAHKNKVDASAVFVPPKMDLELPEEKQSEEFCTTNASANEKPAGEVLQNAEPPLQDAALAERIHTILAEKFANGYREKSAIDRDKFKIFYEERYGEEIKLNNEEIPKRLKEVGMYQNERIYAKTEQAESLAKEIQFEIAEVLQQGASCISMKSLFQHYEKRLVNELNIYNEKDLANLLYQSEKRGYTVYDGLLVPWGKRPNTTQDVFNLLKATPCAMNYEQIQEKLWYLTMSMIKNALLQQPSLINVDAGTYIYARNFPIDNDELSKLKKAIQNRLEHSGYLLDTEFAQLIQEEVPSITINTQEYPDWGVRKVLGYLLRYEFEFRGKVIGPRRSNITLKDVFQMYCKEHESLTLEELQEFADYADSTIYWDSVRSEMIRINETEFWRKDRLAFDTEKVDAVLQELCPGDYIPLREANLYFSFPAMPVPWTEYLVESYVYTYSKKFVLQHAAFQANSCCGAIVRKTANLFTYEDVVRDVLVHSDVSTNEQALNLLIEQGYQVRKTLSNIDKILARARSIRQRTKFKG